MTIGDRIKQLRQKKGLTQEQLAVQIGVERSSIGKYEGKSKVVPSDDVKGRLARFFGVSIDYLIGISDTPYQVSAEMLSADERVLLDIYRQLTVDGRDLLMDQANRLLQTPSLRQDASIQSMG
jgi:transcriptional regulator with XRE-family HTH domain